MPACKQGKLEVLLTERPRSRTGATTKQVSEFTASPQGLCIATTASRVTRSMAGGVWTRATSYAMTNFRPAREEGFSPLDAIHFTTNNRQT